MEDGGIEAVAASLVREYLSRKGLKKTRAVLEEEYPRTSQSINNRNELRSVLHLDSLYKENKLSDRPLKTLLELITKYFLEQFGKKLNFKTTQEENMAAMRVFTKGNGRKKPEAAPLDVYDLSDEDAGESSAVSDSSVTHIYRSGSSKPSYNPKERSGDLREPMSSAGSNKTYENGANPTREPKQEPIRTQEGPGEVQRPKSSRIVRGMMSGPIPSAQELILYSFRTYEDLVTFLLQNISQFERGPFGCVLLTVSVVFSRTFELVQKDFDVPTNCLIGAHDYCTQELVNLVLGGRAVSNVFNDVMELDSGNGNITVLKGISCRSDIGFLSLFEHYNVCQVGSYLKTPKFPIWVVCSESHFSVLFCLKKELVSDWKAERRFDLYYYDGLANQQEEIRLTVDTSGTYIEDEDNDLVPPLEYCIRTKWKGAVVDWNGTDPIL